MIKKTLSTIILILACSNVWAQNHEEHDTHHSKHHIAIFDGATTNFGHSTTGYSLGLDYEYFISDKIGVGMIGEYVFAGEGELILGVPLFFHPTSNLKLGAAPIGIYAEEHHGYHSYDGHEPTNNTVHKEWVLGARLNVAYSLHFGKISAGPSVSLDVANTTAVVYGLAFGIGI
jgi:hypothetical protein